MDELSLPAGQKALFSNKALLALAIPLIVEQFLNMAIGAVDTLMVSAAGEGAVSAVSLVDNVNNLIINVFAALATGGAVVIAQYVGRGDAQNARVAAKQLLYAMIALSAALTAAGLLFYEPLLSAMFGRLDELVMSQARRYFLITACSYPFIAIFNSIAATYRASGVGRVSMFASLLMNVVHAVGNFILINGLGWGAAGAAASTLVSRAAAAGVLLLLIHDYRNAIYIRDILRVELRPRMIKNILRIGIPTGLENGIFHLGRVLLQGLVSSFGTAAIAANAITNSLYSLVQVPGSGLAMAIVTVTGQCMGAGEPDQAKDYLWRLMKYVVISAGVLSALLYVLGPHVTKIYNLSPETTALALDVMRLMAIPTIAVWPFAFPFPNFLRAAGDVKYTMAVSLSSMWLVRIGLSYAFTLIWGMPLIGVWYAVILDWLVRSAAFLARYAAGRWRSKRVI